MPRGARPSARPGPPGRPARRGRAHARRALAGHRGQRLGIRARGSAALRAALPALLGYALVRALGILTLVLWPVHGDGSALRRLATLWDAFWYQAIAVHGYASTAPQPGPYGPYEPYAFFPAYPALIRLVHAVLPVPVHTAALLVAWAAALAAAWGIFAVGAHLYGRRVGVVAAVLWGITPYAVVESAAYSEQLFTAFAAWACYAVLTRRRVWAARCAWRPD
ncbi:glycosyltransferase family 39 protein [Kitasatospora arboriphila]